MKISECIVRGVGYLPGVGIVSGRDIGPGIRDEDAITLTFNWRGTVFGVGMLTPRGLRRAFLRAIGR